MKKVLKTVAALAVAGLVATPAFAASITGNLDVSATVPGACSVGTSTMAFGNYSGTLLEVDGTVTVNCTADQGYSVELDGGGGVTTRQLTNLGDGTKKLGYELYKDIGRTNIWGGAAYTAGTALGTQTGSGTDQAIPVYGRMPAAATPSVGSYADTVTVTVIF